MTAPATPPGAAPHVIRHAVLQLKPLKGRRAENLDRLRTALAELHRGNERPDVVVLPEGALTGYFLQGGVRELAVTAEQFLAELAGVHATAWTGKLDVIAGFYERYRDDYFNSVIYAELGGDHPVIRHVHRKVFLPTYGVFDEDRFLSRGSSFDAFDTRATRAATIICEDAWHSIAPTICALHGASIIYIVSASPMRGLEGTEPGNTTYWRTLVRNIAAEHGVYVVLSSLVGFEGGKALMGASMVAHPDGHIMVEGDAFDEAALIVDLNLDALQAARYDNPLLADLQATLPRVLPSLEAALNPRR